MEVAWLGVQLAVSSMEGQIMPGAAFRHVNTSVCLVSSKETSLASPAFRNT